MCPFLREKDFACSNFIFLQIYELMCSKLGVEHDSILMVGNSIHCDYSGPTANGMNALLIDRFDKNKTLATDQKIKSLSEVLSFI